MQDGHTSIQKDIDKGTRSFLHDGPKGDEQGLDIPPGDSRTNRIGENFLQGFSVPAVHPGVYMTGFSARSVDIDEGCFGAYHWLWIGCALNYLSLTTWVFFVGHVN